MGLLVRAQLGEFIFFVNIIADVAQLAEQLICNQQVIGSSPIIGLVPKRDLMILDL